MSPNQNMSIILAITGSIAAYKTCELIRLLQAQGQDVHVIMSSNAERFVGRLTFETLTGNPVYASEWEAGMVHIAVKNKASVFAIVPATANTIAKFASGIADSIITSTYLAVTCPVIVAPAMNPGMYQHPTLKRNLLQLSQDGVTIVEPAVGEVICGDSGQGKLADVNDICAAILKSIKVMK